MEHEEFISRRTDKGTWSKWDKRIKQNRVFWCILGMYLELFYAWFWFHNSWRWSTDSINEFLFIIHPLLLLFIYRLLVKWNKFILKRFHHLEDDHLHTDLMLGDYIVIGSTAIVFILSIIFMYFIARI